jgi:hypothetical protein
MPTTLIAAGALAMVVSLAHSALGEVLIFRHLRNGGLVPAVAAPPLRERHVRILWATWHLATIFGLSFAIVLLQLGSETSGVDLRELIRCAAIFAFLGGSILVLVGTRGRHPGWVGLSGVAALAWLSQGY